MDEAKYILIKAEVFTLMKAHSDRPAQSLLNTIKAYFKQDDMPMVKQALVELCDNIMGY